jgi:glutamate-1-semialdehyde 2,1-aminomutase
MRYELSVEHLERAEACIPLGSQTFSKSRTQYPVGVSPLYLEKSHGAYSWDLDGNKYIDLVSSLAAVTIGYGNKKIDNAVKKQLKSGVTLSLPTRLEAEVAEILIEMIPSAEKVRFGKNGSDATSAAIRLARAYTGRDHIAMCGYHGWQDWSIASTSRNKGIPRDVINLTHGFKYNDILSLQEIFTSFPNEISAVIMEPMNTTYPNPGFLESVKDLAHRYGALLIFDETITGFRFSNGGAQELFNVTPDLSTFGKGIANGFPISAVVGRSDVMSEMSEIFFSGTFGGELLSLEAARVNLTMYKTDNVVQKLFEIGENLNNALNVMISSLEMNSYLNLSGHPTWKFLTWSPTKDYDEMQLKTYFLQESFAEGLLVLNSNNVTLAHSSRVLKKAISKYESVLTRLSKDIAGEHLMQKLKVEPLQSLFRLR